MPRTPSQLTQSHEPSAGKSGRSDETHFSVREIPIEIVLPPAAGGARIEGRLDARWTTRMTSRTRVVMVGGEGVIRVPAFLLKDREGAFHEVPAGCLSLTRGDFSLPSAYAAMFPDLNEGVCDAKARTVIVCFGLLATPGAGWNIDPIPMKVVVRSFGIKQRGEAVFAGGVGLITSGALLGGMLLGCAPRSNGGGGTVPSGWAPYFPGGQKPTDTIPEYPGNNSADIESATSTKKVKICSWSSCGQPTIVSGQLTCTSVGGGCPKGCGCKLFSNKREGGTKNDWRWEEKDVYDGKIKQDRVYACFCAK